MGLAYFYCKGALLQLYQVNTDRGRHDQSAYMNLARSIAAGSQGSVLSRNRMPLYPALQSLLLQKGLDDAAFFHVGKFANLWLSILALVCAYGLLRVHFAFELALPATAAAGFSVFIFKAAYFQCEVLFYPLFFAYYVALLCQLARPSVAGAVLCGISGGLGFLTKASVLPALGVQFLATLLLVARDFFREGRRAWRQIVTRLLPFAVFIVVTGPYLWTSARVFGDPFYNVNSRYVFWCDNWEQAMSEVFARAADVRKPGAADEMPGPGRYFREHPLSAAGQRMAEGALRLQEQLVKTSGFLPVAVFYGALAALALALVPGPLLHGARAHLPALLAATAILTLYALACCWYQAIDSGLRFPLMLALPFLHACLFPIAVACGAVGKRARHFRILVAAAHALALLAGSYLVQGPLMNILARANAGG